MEVCVKGAYLRTCLYLTVLFPGLINCYQNGSDKSQWMIAVECSRRRVDVTQTRCMAFGIDTLQ